MPGTVQTPEIQNALKTVKDALSDLELRVIEFFSHSRPGVVRFDFRVGGCDTLEDHLRWNNHIYVANIPCNIDPGLLIFCRDASHLSFYGFDE